MPAQMAWSFEAAADVQEHAAKAGLGKSDFHIVFVMTHSSMSQGECKPYDQHPS